MKEKIYIETTVISYYVARPSRDIVIASRQQSTIEWWEYYKKEYECYMSTFVLEEISRGDKDLSNHRIELVKNMILLSEDEEVTELAEKYYDELKIPAKAKLDVFHIAIATLNEMDYILSWNMSHIVNPRLFKKIKKVNDEFGIKTPLICTPEMLIGDENV